jgi:hypothetical protein
MKSIIAKKIVVFVSMYILIGALSNANSDGVLRLPLLLYVDNEKIEVPLFLSLPFIDLSSGIFDGEEDVVIRGFMSSIKENDSSRVVNFIDESSSRVTDKEAFLGFLKSSYFPKGFEAKIIGKIPVKNGFYYIFYRNTGDGSIDFPFLFVVNTENGYKIRGDIPDSLIDLARQSFRFRSLEEFGENIEKVSISEILGLKEELLQKIIHVEGVENEIKKLINDISSSGMRRGFTQRTQDLINNGMLNLSVEEKNKQIELLRNDALMIDFVIDLSPVYISVQKPGSYRGVYYYYREFEDGGLLMTNLSRNQPLDEFIKNLSSRIK